MDLRGCSVLVTGATGFIGGRLVEKLTIEQGCVVRALVRDFRTSAWLSRTPAEIICGDLTNPESMQRAVSGCSLVFHCAAATTSDYEEAYRVNVEGTRCLLEASKREGVRRFILISSVAVHETKQGEEVIDEQASFVDENADAYARTKLAGERVALDFGQRQNLPVVVIRPTIVYGPRSSIWSVGYAVRILKNHFALSRQSTGHGNFVYVDDVVQALILAATASDAIGEAFIIGAEDNTGWTDYLGCYSKMSGKPLPMWPDPLLYVLAVLFDRMEAWIAALKKKERIWNRPLILGLRVFRRILRPFRKLDLWELQLYRKSQMVNIDKAKRILGYQPTADISSTMKETEIWLRLQGYLPDEDESTCN